MKVLLIDDYGALVDLPTELSCRWSPGSGGVLDSPRRIECMERSVGLPWNFD